MPTKSPLWQTDVSVLAELDDAECRSLLAGAIAQERLLRTEKELLKRYENEADGLIKDVTASHVRLLLIAVLRGKDTPVGCWDAYQKIRADDERRKKDAEKWGEEIV